MLAQAASQTSISMHGKYHVLLMDKEIQAVRRQRE
jgi:hypothetical protein